MWRNEEILSIDEKQLTTKEIFELGSLENIQYKLINKKVLEHTMCAYPKRVNLFQNLFHVGIHSKKSPINLAPVHDFIEVRNVIQHSRGHASPQYISRISPYKSEGYKPLISREFSTPKVDFVWLIDFAQKLLELAGYIDEQVGDKWKTTRNLTNG